MTILNAKDATKKLHQLINEQPNNKELYQYLVTKLKKTNAAKINSKQKGSRGEREVANMLKEYGYDCRRGQQYNGLDGEDVVGLSGIHIEVKRVEGLQLYNAIDQAKRDANNDKFPCVFHKRNNHEWVVIMLFDNWIELYREWDAGR